MGELHELVQLAFALFAEDIPCAPQVAFIHDDEHIILFKVCADKLHGAMLGKGYAPAFELAFCGRVDAVSDLLGADCAGGRGA